MPESQLDKKNLITINGAGHFLFIIPIKSRINDL